jgi:hypothetical protein
MICTPHEYYSGDQNEAIAMGREGQRIQDFDGENLKEKGFTEHLGREGIIILKWIVKKWNGGSEMD